MPYRERRMFLDFRAECFMPFFWRWLNPTMQLAKIDHNSV